MRPTPLLMSAEVERQHRLSHLSYGYGSAESAPPRLPPGAVALNSQRPRAASVSRTAASRIPMPETDWAKWGLTEEVVVVIVKPKPGSKLGVTLSSFDDDVPHPRVTGATSTPHCTALCCRTRKESPHPPCTLSTHWMAHLSYGLHSLWQR